jgi:D-sedoheptulose 7-phosphate isomerase
MFMLEQRIQQQFFDSADLVVRTAEPLVRPVAEAAQAIVGCLTGGGKLLVYGHGASRGLAIYLADAMVGRFERERPGLATIRIGDGAAPLSAQIHALGSPGDLLVLLAADAHDESLLPADAVAHAHAKEMSVVALVGAPSAAVADGLTDTDVLVAVGPERAARVHELHLLIVHSLCDAVDLQLMGEEHAE